jgi:hypothetical protein
MSEESLTFNDSVEFIDFIDKNERIRGNFEKNFEVVWGNIKDMRESLKHKPCGCGGVSPDAVIAERKNNLENVYKTWLASLGDDEIQVLKSSLGHDAILKSGGEILLEI